jgi:hypothetical protein
MENGVDQPTLENRMMKLKVRTKGIIQSVVDNTNVKDMPIPLVIFLSNLVKPKAYVPQNFLTEFELNRLETDQYGAVGKLNEAQIKMIASLYIFGKVLVAKVLFNP